MTPLRSTNADAGSLGQRQRGKWIVTSHHMLASPVQFSSSTIHTQPGTETGGGGGGGGDWEGGLREGGRGWGGRNPEEEGLKDVRHKLNLACRNQFSQHSAENERTDKQTGQTETDRKEGGEREGERRWTEVNGGGGGGGRGPKGDEGGSMLKEMIHTVLIW